MDPTPDIRFGSVPYLNAEPLLTGLRRDGRAVRALVPSELVRELRAGTLDVALAPVIAGFEDPTLTMVPGAGVASRGPVGSVLLFARRPPPECRTVGLDTSSRTSANLVRVLFRHLWRANPRFAPRRPDPDVEHDPSDAVLLIGDPALAAARRRAAQPASAPPVDLGEVWTRWTGLPFLFAAWFARTPELAAAAAPLVAASRATGRASIDELAAAGALSLNLDREATQTYLREQLVHDVGDLELRGMERFRELWATLDERS
ncbi:MAG: Chorismate dehydratase [Planctomycetes bacterium]|nr:Chorismate dehydratase [Planctomycetota bacterium]